MRGPVIRSLCQPGSAEAVSWISILLFEDSNYMHVKNMDFFSMMNDFILHTRFLLPDNLSRMGLLRISIFLKEPARCERCLHSCRSIPLRLLL